MADGGSFPGWCSYHRYSHTQDVRDIQKAEGRKLKRVKTTRTGARKRRRGQQEAHLAQDQEELVFGALVFVAHSSDIRSWTGSAVHCVLVE